MSVILDQDRPTSPAPAAVDALHGGSIILGFGLRVQMVGAAPPLAGENLARLDILHLESSAFGDLAASAVEPVQLFGLWCLASRSGIGLCCFLRVFGIQFRQGFRPDLSVIVQAVPLLEALDGALGSFAIVSVNASRVIAKTFQFLLYLFYCTACVARSASPVILFLLGLVGFFVFGVVFLVVFVSLFFFSYFNVLLINIAGFPARGHFIPVARGILDGHFGPFLEDFDHFAVGICAFAHVQGGGCNLAGLSEGDTAGNQAQKECQDQKELAFFHPAHLPSSIDSGLFYYAFVTMSRILSKIL